MYGVNLLLAAVAYFLLQSAIIADEGPGSRLKAALGRDQKCKISPVLYVAGILLSFLEPLLGLGLYVFVALMWLVPDRRIAAVLGE